MHQPPRPRETPIRYATSHTAGLLPAVRELFAARMREHRAPSAAVALIADGGIVGFAGLDDGTVSAAPGLDTAFRVASCTKSFTATVLLQQRDAGRIDLNAPVSEYLDLAVVPEGTMPTIAHLASMAAGFPTDDPWGDRQESLAIDEFDRDAARGFRLVHTPGERFEYSNLGFALLGRALERVTGRRYIDLVMEDVVAPLGLGGIGFDRSVAASEIATGYARVGAEWEPQPFSDPGAFSPIGGVFATPRALSAWVAWHAAAWQAGADGHQEDVLSAASRRELTQIRTPMDRLDGGYALGLVTERHPRHGTIVSHSGGYPGFGAHMRWHPGSGVGIVALENARYSGATGPATQALDLVLDAIAVPDAVPDVWPETLAARGTVEALLRGWDDRAAADLFAVNIEQDEPLPRRRAHLERLAAQVGLDAAAPVPDLVDVAPSSNSRAHLVWRVRGRTGSLRCEIKLTPELEPRVQTLTVRLG